MSNSKPVTERTTNDGAFASPRYRDEVSLLEVSDDKTAIVSPSRVRHTGSRRPRYATRSRRSVDSRLKPQHACSYCSTTFAVQTRLYVHMKLHSIQKTYPCLECSEQLVGKYQLAIHMKTHRWRFVDVPEGRPPGKPTKRFRAALLRLEMQRAKKERRGSDVRPSYEPSYHCQFCIRTFRSSSQLVSHTRSHTGEKPYSCRICCLAFALKRSVVAHLRIHGAKAASTGANEWRLADFIKKHLQSAIKKRSNFSKPLYQCQSCTRAFRSSLKLFDHMKSHSGEKPFSCLICDKTYATKSGVVAHLSTHTTRDPLICTLCGSKLKSKCFLERHTRMCCKSFYRCQFCSRTFKTGSRLFSHVRTHTGEKPYTCRVCLKAFAQKRRVVAHMEVHTADRPFVCSFCSRPFRLECSLTRHTRFHHTVERAWECEYCKKPFDRESTFESHTRIHTGEKPFVCELCGSAFRVQNYLDRHHEKDHREEYQDSE